MHRCTSAPFPALTLAQQRPSLIRLSLFRSPVTLSLFTLETQSSPPPRPVHSPPSRMTLPPPLHRPPPSPHCHPKDQHAQYSSQHRHDNSHERHGTAPTAERLRPHLPFLHPSQWADVLVLDRAQNGDGIQIRDTCLGDGAPGAWMGRAQAGGAIL